MPESFWIDRTMQELEKFLDHNLVRKHLDADLLRALHAEHERLFHLVVAQQAVEAAEH